MLLTGIGVNFMEVLFLLFTREIFMFYIDIVSE